MDVNGILEQLLQRARTDCHLRQELLSTRHAEEPMTALCETASRYGFHLTPGEMLAAGEEYCSNLHKSVNGGATYPLEGWDDLYELFFAALALME